MITQHRFLAAVILCISSLSFTLNDTTTKFLIADYDVSVIILIRSLLALPVLYLFYVKSSGKTRLWSSNMRLHALRGAIGLGAAYLYIAALRTLSVAEATVIVFLSPILTTIMSRWFLKENISWRSWASVCLCFIGVVIAVQPGTASLNGATLLVALSSLLYAFNAINARFIPAEDNLWSIAFFGAFFAALFIAPFSIQHWNGVDPAHLYKFAAAAACSSLGIGLGAVAYRMASPSFLAPFSYSTLIWSIVVTWLFWGAIPAPASLLGAAVIICSVALTLKRSKPPQAQSAPKGVPLADPKPSPQRD